MSVIYFRIFWFWARVRRMNRGIKLRSLACKSKSQQTDCLIKASVEDLLWKHWNQRLIRKQVSLEHKTLTRLLESFNVTPIPSKFYPRSSALAPWHRVSVCMSGETLHSGNILYLLYSHHIHQGLNDFSCSSLSVRQISQTCINFVQWCVWN